MGVETFTLQRGYNHFKGHTLTYEGHKSYDKANRWRNAGITLFVIGLLGVSFLAGLAVGAGVIPPIGTNFWRVMTVPLLFVLTGLACLSVSLAKKHRTLTLYEKATYLNDPPFTGRSTF